MSDKKVVAVGRVVNGVVEIKTATPLETVPEAWEVARIEAQQVGGSKLVKFFNKGEGK